VVGNSSVQAWGDGAAMTYQWKSKKFSLPSETSFSMAQVEAESYPLDYTIWADGEVLQTGTIVHRGLFRLKSILARDWEIELRGTSEVFNVVLAQAGEELASV